MSLTTDHEFAHTLALARKAGVIIVQSRTGGIRTFEKRPPRKPRGKEVGGFELKRRLAKISG